MSNNPVEDERLDNDPTDELPILLDTAVLDPAEHRVVVGSGSQGDEDTGQHTVLLTVPSWRADQSASAGVDALRVSLEQRDATIAELERENGGLSSRCLDAEQRLAQKDAAIAEIGNSVETLRASLAERFAAEQRLTAEVADRDGQFNELLNELDRLRRNAAAAESEVAAARAAAEAARAELAEVRAAAAARSEPPNRFDELAQLREEHAALAHSIANRHALWQELEARADAAARRVVELEAELPTRAARQRDAEALARAETGRASRLRAQLVERSRQAEALERELRTLRGTSPGADESAALRAQLAAAQAAAARLATDLAAANEQLVAERAGRASDAEEQRAALAAAQSAAQRPPVEAPLVPMEQSEVLAQLEAELEHRREQLAAHRSELHEQGERLTAATAELEPLRRQLAEVRAQLEEKRSDVVRLERTLVDKDRALEARDERIGTLQRELEERLGALQRQTAVDVSAERLKRPDSPRPESMPSLVCLTSEQPRKYAISKSSMTIGRGSQCDIQILTHFVSREHARVTIGRDGIFIEDLGSTNGVFVNSVRVERHELRHSDLVTVGETQFRFLETMAH